MTTTYKIPMSKTVITIFLLAVIAITAAVVWSFRSGFMWSGICLIVVAGPLSIFYWYMIYITPKRATVAVADEGILLSAPPFASAVIPWASVEKHFPVNLLTDEKFQIAKTKKFMSFGGYKSGIVEIQNSREAVIVTNRTDVLCFQTADRYYLLGPSDMPGFQAQVDTIRG